MRLKFSTEERGFILDSNDDSGVSGQLQKAAPRAGEYEVECSLDSLELLIAALAEKADYAGSEARQRAFWALCGRLEAIQEGNQIAGEGQEYLCGTCGARITERDISDGRGRFVADVILCQQHCPQDSEENRT